MACWARHRGRGPAEDYAGDLPSTYALARLAQRGRLVADSALAALAYEGRISFSASKEVRRTALAPPTSAYELSLWREIATNGSPLVETRRWGFSANNAALRALDEELVAAGLVLPAPERQRLNRLPLATAAALGAFGVVKVLVGVNRDRPVGFLVFSLILLAIVTGVLLYYGAWATGRGATVLQSLEERLARQRGRPDGPNVVIMAVAVLGVSSLHSLGLSQLATNLAPATDGSSSDSSGSGCAGGGCGGGGCGGCGS